MTGAPYRLLFRVLAHEDAAYDLAGVITILIDQLANFLLAGRVLFDPGHIRQDLSPCVEDIALVGKACGRFRFRLDDGRGRLAAEQFGQER
jgi:hypothetical protein